MVRIHDEEPATVQQLAAAMAALGMYDGANTLGEHAEEARRLGGPAAYRMRLANALLGAVQTEVVLLESTTAVSHEELRAAHRQQLITAGAQDDPAKLMLFLRWQVLRASTPLREIAQDEEAGPIALAAAHAADALHQLLGIVASGQNATVDDALTLSSDLRAARQRLVDAIVNVDILLDMLAIADDLTDDL